MSILNTIVSYFTKSRIERIEYFIKNPAEVQYNSFKNILSKGIKTEFGNKYGFSSINTIEDFQKQVPISTYEELYPFIAKMLKGEANILWNDPVKWFSKSSGTTNAKSKFIPLPDDALEDIHMSGGKDLIAVYLHNNPESDFYKGKGLVLGGSLSEEENGIKAGDVSALIMDNLPMWAELMRTPDLKTALNGDYEQKLAQIVQKTITKNVTNFSGVPTWSYILIKQVLEKTGKDNILDIWPNLEWYAHGGVNFEPYRELFKKIIPSDSMNYSEIYNASEGFFAIQDQKNSKDLLLLIDYGIFYEFIPMDKLGDNNYEAITIEDVELNKNYALVITVMGGLWRYLIGDTIRFTSIKPHRIRITGRIKHFINAFGEELMIDNAEQGMKEACQQTNSTIIDYTVAPVYLSTEGKGCHQWLIEFEDPPTDIDKFSMILDKSIREINSDYDAKRSKNIALENLEVIVAPKDFFYNHLKSINKLGGQNKIPRLKNDRTVMNVLLDKL